MTSRTQTGILIGTCPECDKQHPITRRHCVTCGIPTLFLDGGGECLKCGHDQRFNTPENAERNTMGTQMNGPGAGASTPVRSRGLADQKGID